MITVRASTAESFRLFMDPDCDFISTEEIEARIRQGQADGESPSDAAALGTAFHAAIAGDDVAGRLFDSDSILWARAGLEGALSEVEGSVVLDVDGVPVRITGHADWLRGLDLWDLKTSAKPIPSDKHAESMQWRAYVLIFAVERVTYRLVQLDERVNEDGDRWHVAKAIDDVVMYPYPRLREDVVSCLRSLLAFARLRGCLDAMDDNPNRKPVPDWSLAVP